MNAMDALVSGDGRLAKARERVKRLEAIEARNIRKHRQPRVPDQPLPRTHYNQLETAAIMGVSEATIRKLVRAGRLVPTLFPGQNPAKPIKRYTLEAMLAAK